MKTYKVKVTPDAKKDFKRYIKYIKDNLANPQAAKSVAGDYKETKESLKSIAGSLSDPESFELKKRGLKRINFRRHNFFLLYRVMGDTAEITNMFHGSEDFENKLK